MRIYAVGGAVRDELLGLPVRERDWVVVGATPEEMVARGFRPVGHDFPVFLHPKTHEEYALARTERKTAPGYTGFVFHAEPSVTLEEDLARRDLTINAIARDADGSLIDPYGGRSDLASKLLRHISPAFGEDPVRILRIARFTARFADFSVAPETLALMRRMVESGEVDTLVPERVWQELSRGLMESQPARMFVVLHDCGALERLLPEITDIPPPGTMGTLPARFAALVRHLSAADIRALCARLRVPATCREVALAACQWQGELIRFAALSAQARLAVLEGCDALRRPDRFDAIRIACGAPETPLKDALAAARSVDAGAIAKGCADPGQIAARIHEARVSAIKP